LTANGTPTLKEDFTLMELMKTDRLHNLA